MAEKTIMEALAKIQSELKAPKSQYNSFGKYAYRSAEDILEAVKPLCAKHGAILTLSDEIVSVGDRVYVKATAALNSTDGSNVRVSAFAREPEDKKGMDASQVTGTASSYARKYALNGLFCIDDTKDADTDEYRNQTAAKPKKILCSACRAEIKPITGKDGKPYSADDIARMNGGMCVACFKAAKAQTN